MLKRNIISLESKLNKVVKEIENVIVNEKEKYSTSIYCNVLEKIEEDMNKFPTDLRKIIEFTSSWSKQYQIWYKYCGEKRDDIIVKHLSDLNKQITKILDENNL